MSTQTVLHNLSTPQSSNIPYSVRTSGYVTRTDKLFGRSTVEHKIERQDTLEFLEKWLRESKQPYCALLGEYGMGKTTTCQMFARILLEKHALDSTSPLPIYLDLRHLGNSNNLNDMDLASIIESVLNTSHTQQIATPSQGQEIIQLVREEKALVIFDGLDEVLVHLTATEGQKFTRKLLGIVPIKNFGGTRTSTGKILLSCRSHFFRTMRDQKTHLTLEDRGGITTNDYCLFTLLPFTPEQVFEYLKHTVTHIDTNALIDLMKSVHNLSELAERPYTLSLIPSLIPQIEQWKKDGVRITGVTLYRHIIHSWLKRDTGKHTLQTAHKQYLMEHFAAELWRSGKRFWNISNIENWFIEFLYARPEIAESYVLDHEDNKLYLILETMKEDLRTATFLVRIGESDFCFAHTSLQEFFLATYLCNCLLEGRLENWNMPVVSKETLGFLGQLLCELNESKLNTALQGLRTIRDTYRPQISELGFAYMLVAHVHDYPTPSPKGIRLEGAILNEWSIMGKLGTAETGIKLLDLSGASFKGAKLNHATISYVNLDRTDFSGAEFSEVELILGQAQDANFENANMVATSILDMNFRGAKFSGAQLRRSEWVRCKLEHVQGLESVPLSSFTLCEPRETFKKRLSGNLLDSETHQAFIGSCKFSPDGQHVASVSINGTLSLWNVSTNQRVQVFAHDEWLLDCDFSPNAKHIASCGSDSTIQIWDLSNGQCLNTLRGHQDFVRTVHFSPDGLLMASCSDDKTIRIWDTATHECKNILLGHQDAIKNCSLSPTQPLVASASDDQTLRLWDISTGTCLKVFRGHTSWIRNCKFSPDGNLLCSASGDKTIRVWDIQSGECVHVLEGHAGRIRSCAISHDGKYLASASYDHTLRIWDLTTGKHVRELQGHQEKVRSCAFSIHGQLVSASDDLTLRIWNISTGECTHILGKRSNPQPQQMPSL